jgi:RNA polymerase sigma-70 factor (ECF subfamily)
VELWREPTHFQREATLDTSLTARAHQLAVKWCRRQAASRSSDVVDAPIPSSPSLQTALDTLPSDQQRALTMAYFGGRTYREVAAALSISEVAAKTQLRLALSQLTSHLPTEGMSAWT